MQKSDRSIYSVHDFLQWREGNSLELTPKFQRRGVWTSSARSFFVDTILREMPIPPIYIRLTQPSGASKIIRQVIDGQQRLTTLLDYVDGKYRLSRSLVGPWRGKTFDELEEDERSRIAAAGFNTEMFRGISDLEVLEMFARLNTYSVPLNAQELRNGKFFGKFKQTAYGLAYEHLQFWRTHKLFTEQRIARMLEVELTSELMIASLVGMQDKKTSIGDFYEEFEESFAKKQNVERRFRSVIDVVNDAVPESLAATEFRRSPLFYTLFCVVYHRMFKLPSETARTPRRSLNRHEKLSLGETLRRLSDYISDARANSRVPMKYGRFIAACLRQTDNIRPRKVRFATVYKLTFSS